MTDYSTAWCDLLPWRPAGTRGLHCCAINGTTWITDGYIGWVDEWRDPDQLRPLPDKARSTLAALLEKPRRPLVLTGEVVNRYNQACAVLYDGDTALHVVAGQLGRLADEAPGLWVGDGLDQEDVEAALCWSAVDTTAGQRAVIIENRDGPLAYVMPPRVEP